MDPKQRLKELKRQAHREVLEHYFGDHKKANSTEGRIIASGIHSRLIEEEKKINPEFAAFAAKRLRLNLILMGIAGFFLLVFVLLIVVIASTEDPEESQQTTTDSAQMNIVLYPPSFHDAVDKAKKMEGTKVQKFKEFESVLLGLDPTEAEMKAHSKVILEAYQSVSFESIQTLTDSTLLKQIYSARVVDKYYTKRYVNYNNTDPLADLAFDYYQIAKDTYRQILTQEFYDANKSQMDKKFLNIK